MRIDVVTLFPEMFQAITEYGISKRAVLKRLLTIHYWNPRDYTQNRHKAVDDRPYGGGPGMVMQYAPLRDAIRAAKENAALPAFVVYLSPQGIRLDQKIILSLLKKPRLVFVAGRYEGIDERLMEQEIDAEYSIGDYVLSGGELAAMVCMDALIRMLPDALGDAGSASQDSFFNGLLDHPHYTNPQQIDGRDVPDVLLSGDHAAISRWRLKQSLGRTWLKRADLLQHLQLDAEQKLLLQEFQQEFMSAKHHNE